MYQPRPKNWHLLTQQTRHYEKTKGEGCGVAIGGEGEWMIMNNVWPQPPLTLVEICHNIIPHYADLLEPPYLRGIHERNPPLSSQI